ncbi:type II toxin-antitoxin system VapC family toxin [Arsenicicoccus piscis]|uniref:Ribonuclease VapC n=1 Tax=Arsenicicoccus piscis TaxID=673954 RepID=A0ABQ6HNI5_9MICO|nr:type II toxin-antitoxin system VapC family toxin [Arsenicicoccus piscis]MCH8628420.1 type II toxin-antitoxin system VapC family toxin [Arsenicicoccus piscis]GMA20023.1 ribonuclease VapC [Arsenicicoccus piscis]
MIVDANVLLYAVDGASPFHRVARTWLDDALNGTERVGLPWVSLLAFQRIVTHPRVTTDPLSPADAWSYVNDWLDADLAWVPTPGQRHRDILRRLILAGTFRGNMITDAHLAALALEHGTSVCSFDSDFARFDGLRWTNPARP